MRKLYFAIVLLAALPSAGANAATILIPAHWDTITSAVAAATNGDTILITTNGPFTDAPRINKKVTIIADAGLQVVIRASGNPIVNFLPGSEGAQLGSVSGGRIIFDGNDTVSRYVYFSQAGGETTLMENLEFRNPNDAASSFYGYWWVLPGTANVTIRRVDMDASSHPGSQGVRSDNAGGTILFERSSVKATGYGMHNNPSVGGSSHMTFINCEISAGGVNYAAYLRPAATGFNRTWNFVNCKITGPTGGGFRWTPAVGDKLDLSYSIISSSARGIFFNAGSDATTTIDHCDIIVSGAFAPIDIPAGSNRTISIKNSNIYGPSAGATYTAGGGDTVTMAYSNDYSPTTPYNNFTPANSVQPGQNPGFVNPATGDHRLTNTFLKTAGEGGSAIGVNRDYTDVVNFTTVSRANHWMMY